MNLCLSMYYVNQISLNHAVNCFHKTLKVKQLSSNNISGSLFMRSLTFSTLHQINRNTTHYFQFFNIFGQFAVTISTFFTPAVLFFFH